MLIAVTHGLGCASFVALILLMLLNRKPAGIGLFAVGVFLLTALWAGMEAAQFVPLMGTAHVLDSLKTWMWLQFIAVILIAARGEVQKNASLLARFILPIVAFIIVANDFRYLTSIASPYTFAADQILGRLVLATIGILLVENLYRNTVPARRWHIVPFCLAAGLIFAYDLFVFTDSVIEGQVNTTLIGGRGVMLALITPLLVLTLARNENWRVDIHVSRRVVFHTATLTAGGLFLIAAAGIASVFGGLSDVWGPALQVFFFCGALVVLASIVGAESLQKRLKRLLAENFFSHRYDYREEWMNLVERLSEKDGPESLEERVIRAVADVVESPGGALWFKDKRGDYRLIKAINFAIEGDAIERSNSDFVKAFQSGEVVQDLGARKNGEGLEQPKWLSTDMPAHLAVPLAVKGQVLGFIVLAKPRLPVTLNWESFALLKTIGQQVASYLTQERATRLLSETKAIAEYNKRYAFVIHDVKNLASQLKMLLPNVQKHGSNPEFQKDMAVTLQNALFRIDHMLTRLRSGGALTEPTDPVKPLRIVKDVAAGLPEGRIALDAKSADCDLEVAISASDLQSVLTHLLQNALEASPPETSVTVCVYQKDTNVVIDIEDRGPGMDEAFVEQRLFKPLQTTKSGGHGIGAFQAREILREAGGELTVMSAVGQGTTMRIIMPIKNELPAVQGREVRLA